MPSPRYMREDSEYQQPSISFDRYGSSTRPTFAWKPIVVPQTTANWSSPWIRSYADILGDQFDISPGRWLAFLDGLNEVHVKNAGLKVTGQIAQITGFIPSAIAAGVSAGVQIAAGAGDAARSKILTGKYLKQANEMLFHPRGMTVRILSTDKALALLGLPPAAKTTSDDILLHARNQLAGQTHDPYAVETAFAPFGDAVQQLHIIPEQQRSTADDDTMMSKFNRLSVGMESWSNNRKANKAAEKLLKAERKGKQRKIEKETAKYARATGQQVEGVQAKQGLIGGLRSKLGGGSTLWLVVLPLEDASRVSPLPSPSDSQMGSYSPSPRSSYERISYERRAVPPPVPSRSSLQHTSYASPPAYYDSQRSSYPEKSYGEKQRWIQ